MSMNQASLLHGEKTKQKQRHFTPSDEKLQQLTSTGNTSLEADVF